MRVAVSKEALEAKIQRQRNTYHITGHTEHHTTHTEQQNENATGNRSGRAARWRTASARRPICARNNTHGNTIQHMRTNRASSQPTWRQTFRREHTAQHGTAQTTQCTRGTTHNKKHTPHNTPNTNEPLHPFGRIEESIRLDARHSARGYPKKHKLTHSNTTQYTTHNTTHTVHNTHRTNKTVPLHPLRRIEELVRPDAREMMLLSCGRVGAVLLCGVVCGVCCVRVGWCWVGVSAGE